MSLKELTMQQHADAERQKFASVLMSGTIAEISYLMYLVNQNECYKALETHSTFDLPNEKLKRSHNIEKDSANKVGPNLWNLINRPKANISGFAYSKALAELGGEWTYEDLSQFLYKPKDYLKGTKMNFSGLKKDEDRANLILFLRNQSDNPVPLP